MKPKEEEIFLTLKRDCGQEWRFELANKVIDLNCF